MRPLRKVKIELCPNFAYAIGLITTDGNLSIDGRHINFTSKDLELVETFRKCLYLNNKIGRKARGGEKEKKYHVVQSGDKNFYGFLLSIGLMPTKSKKLNKLLIPIQYFPDFLRGCIDGDGNINIFKHPESRHPQLRVRLSSASPLFLDWIYQTVKEKFSLKGGWIETKEDVSVLVYAKADAIQLLRLMYYTDTVFCLRRKQTIAKPFLRV